MEIMLLQRTNNHLYKCHPSHFMFSNDKTLIIEASEKKSYHILNKGKFITRDFIKYKIKFYKTKKNFEF